MKKLFIGLGIFVAILGVISILFFIFAERTFDPEGYYLPIVEKVALSGKPLECFDLPKKADNPLDLHSGYSPINLCIDKMAILYANASICDVYLSREDFLESSPLDPTGSRGNCRRELALFYNDSIYCGDDFCLYSLAEKTKNYSICLEISNETNLQLGYNGYKVSCLDKLAGYFNDSSICEYHENSLLKTECNEIVFAKLAENQMDIDYCNKIVSQEKKEKCFVKVYTLLAISTGNSSYCVVKTLTEDDLNNCYIQIAKKLNDLSYCDKVSDKHHNYCLDAVKYYSPKQ